MPSLNPRTWFARKPASSLVESSKATAMSLEIERQAIEIRKLKQSSEIRESYSGYPLFPWFGGIAPATSALYNGIQGIGSAAPILFDPTLNQGIFFTQSMLDTIRAYARWFVAKTPQASGVIEAKTDYAVGTGNEYEIQAKPDERVGKEVLRTAQRISDGFCCVNQMFLTEVDWYKRWHIDGEVFYRLFPNSDGIARLRTVEPQCVREKDTSRANIFGVVTDEEDREETLGFSVTYTGIVSDAEFVPADEMALLKRNTAKQVKRGLSDFFCLSSTFEDAMRLFRNSLQGESGRQAILYILETTNAANDLKQFGANDTPAGPGYTCNSADHMSGPTVPVIDKNLQFKPVPPGASAAAVALLAEAWKALAVYFRVPTFMVSGGGDNSFAGGLLEQDPLIMMVRREQRVFAEFLSHLLRAVLRIAEEQGDLPSGTVDRLKIIVKNPSIITRDKAAETQRNSTLAAAHLLSPRTWSDREDLDYEAEQQSIAETGPAVVVDAGGQAAAVAAPSTTPAATLERNDPHPLSKGGVNGNS
jgi:hypothetical protein